MLENGGWALAGLIAFGLGLLKLSPIRPGERAAEVVLALISAFALLLTVGEAFGLVVPGPAGGNARVMAFWVGAGLGYLLYRLLPKRAARPEPPRMSAEYHAATRQIDEAFEGLKADAARGAPDELARTKAHFRQVDRGFEALAREGERIRLRSRQTYVTAFVILMLLLLYLAIHFLVRL